MNDHDGLVTPEGQAFSDYIESKEDNPYTRDTAEHGRYESTMRRLLKSHQEAEG